MKCRPFLQHLPPEGRANVNGWTRLETSRPVLCETGHTYVLYQHVQDIFLS